MSLSDKCPNCRVQLPHENGFVFCSSCKAPEFTGDLRSPFEIFGVPLSFQIDSSALEERYYELSRRLHPDRFSAAGVAAKIKSQELSAALNQSYRALHEPENRLETLLRTIGAVSPSELSASKEQIPADLAEEFFTVQEQAMDAAAEGRIADGVGAVDRFSEALNAKRQLMTREMFEQAMHVDWAGTDAKRSTAVEKIVELRRNRSYVRSMIDNLAGIREKVAGKSGA